MNQLICPLCGSPAFMPLSDERTMKLLCYRCTHELGRWTIQDYPVNLTELVKTLKSLDERLARLEDHESYQAERRHTRP